MESKRVKNKLNNCKFKQQILLDFSLQIGTDVHFKDLLDKFEDLLREHLGIGKVVLFTQGAKWKPILISGVDEKEYAGLDVEKEFIGKLNKHKPSTYANYTSNDFDIIIPVFQGTNPLAFLLVSDINGQKLAVSPIFKHLKFIQTLTNIVVVAIEKNRLFAKNLEREMAFKEMDLASKVQNILIPDLSEFKPFKSISLVSFYLPHFVVGGDYYDALKINDDECAFCVADISGKGISAALLLSTFQSNFRLLFTGNNNLIEIAANLNKKIFDVVHGEKFITAFIGIFNDKTNTLRYINLGHNPPIFFNKTTQETQYLKEGGMGLGIMKDFENLQEGSLTLNNNSKLLCYTDGLVEYIVEDKIYMYYQEIEEYFCTKESSRNSINNMVDKMNLHKDNIRIFDDITTLGIDFDVE